VRQKKRRYRGATVTKDVEGTMMISINIDISVPLAVVVEVLRDKLVAIVILHFFIVRSYERT
jgi:hypothetical protein